MEGQNKSITFDGREIRLTTGLYAPQASGSVMIECGDTSLLVTATKTTKKEVSDFLPLICDYEEKLYAAGRIPGGFMRREGRPPERATLKNGLAAGPEGTPLTPCWTQPTTRLAPKIDLTLRDNRNWLFCALFAVEMLPQICVGIAIQ